MECGGKGSADALLATPLWLKSENRTALLDFQQTRLNENGKERQRREGM